MKPVFNERLFWDVDFKELDYDKKAAFVISRVFERGDIEDIRSCRRYYGDSQLADVLLHVRYLPEQIIYLAAAIIDKEIIDFECYKNRQLTPGLFPY